MGTAISAACVEETAGIAHTLCEALAESFSTPFCVLEVEQLGDLQVAAHSLPFELSEGLLHRLATEVESRQTSFALPLSPSLRNATGRGESQNLRATAR